MKSKILGGWVAGLVCMMSPLIAATASTVIIDTGQPSSLSFDGSDYRAGQFTLSSAYTINQIEHFVYVSLNQGGTVTFAIRADSTDGSGLPGAQIFSTVATLVENYVGHSYPEYGTWQGPSGLNWALQAGTYWVTIEQPAGSTAGQFQRLVGYGSSNPPNPMAAEANSVNGTTWYLDGNDANAGWRISGTPAAVPLPAAAWLLLSGLGGLGFIARRKSA